MILPSLIPTAAGRVPSGRTTHRPRITRSNEGKAHSLSPIGPRQGLDLHVGMIASQGPEVIGVTGCDDPSAEAHGSGNHESVNSVTRIQAVTMAEPTGEPRHS